MNKLKSVFIFLIIGFFLISFVSAQPPFEEGASFFTSGLVIEFSQLDVHELNKNITFNAHVFNISNGVIITNTSANCFFHLFKEDGSHLINNIIMPFDVIGQDWEIIIDKGNFTKSEEYSYLIVCNTSKLGGFVSVGFDITPSGAKAINAGEGSSLLGIFLTLILAIIFFLCFGILTTNIPFKVFFTSLSILFLIGTIGFGFNVMEQLLGSFPSLISNYGIFYRVLIILMGGGAIGLLLYLIITAFKSLESYRTQVENA